MDINATLFGQMITFVLFAWFVKAFVWPPMIKALQDRQAKIADGLAAAEKGQQSLIDASQKRDEILAQSKQEASEMVVTAEKKADKVVDDARQKAHEEGHRIIQQAQAEIDQMVASAKNDLKAEVAAIALLGAQKILEKGVDQQTHDQMLDKLVENI